VLRITQVKSRINRKKDHKATLNALGISRMGQTVYHEDSPAIRGMVHKVSYMLQVDVVDINRPLKNEVASAERGKRAQNKDAKSADRQRPPKDKG
jgi:large subunit ribosomal protein L30